MLRTFLDRFSKETFRFIFPDLGIEIVDDDGRLKLSAQVGSLVAKFMHARSDRREALMKTYAQALEDVCRRIPTENTIPGEGVVSFIVREEQREVPFVAIAEVDEMLKYERRECIPLPLNYLVEFFEEVEISATVFRFMQMLNSYRNGSLLEHANDFCEEDPVQSLTDAANPPDAATRGLEEYVHALQSVEGQQFVDVAKRFFDERASLRPAQIMQTAAELIKSAHGDTTENNDTDEITVTLSLEKWNALKNLLK